jgi:hypothetical protein
MKFSPFPTQFIYLFFGIHSPLNTVFKKITETKHWTYSIIHTDISLVFMEKYGMVKYS